MDTQIQKGKLKKKKNSSCKNNDDDYEILYDWSINLS